LNVAGTERSSKDSRRSKVGRTARVRVIEVGPSGRWSDPCGPEFTARTSRYPRLRRRRRVDVETILQIVCPSYRFQCVYHLDGSAR
jgi:hypothetical protein